MTEQRTTKKDRNENRKNEHHIQRCVCVFIQAVLRNETIFQLFQHMVTFIDRPGHKPAVGHIRPTKSPRMTGERWMEN